MTSILWLTNIETAEPVGVPLSKLLLIEQKRAQDGGAVALYLDHGREVHVSESLPRVTELIGTMSKQDAGSDTTGTLATSDTAATLTSDHVAPVLMSPPASA